MILSDFYQSGKTLKFSYNRFIQTLGWFSDCFTYTSKNTSPWNSHYGSFSCSWSALPPRWASFILLLNLLFLFCFLPTCTSSDILVCFCFSFKIAVPDGRSRESSAIGEISVKGFTTLHLCSRVGSFLEGRALVCGFSFCVSV